MAVTGGAQVGEGERERAGELQWKAGIPFPGSVGAGRGGKESSAAARGESGHGGRQRRVWARGELGSGSARGGEEEQSNLASLDG